MESDNPEKNNIIQFPSPPQRSAEGAPDQSLPQPSAEVLAELDKLNEAGRTAIRAVRVFIDHGRRLSDKRIYRKTALNLLQIIIGDVLRGQEAIHRPDDLK